MSEGHSATSPIFTIPSINGKDLKICRTTDTISIMTFNDILIEKGITVYRLSKKSGIAKTTLFDIASGKSNILDCSGRILMKIASELNLSIEELLSLDKELYNPVFEEELPPFLDESIKQLKKARRQDSFLLDCYYDETNSTINVCEVEQLITSEQANYLRKKYL